MHYIGLILWVKLKYLCVTGYWYWNIRYKGKDQLTFLVLDCVEGRGVARGGLPCLVHSDRSILDFVLQIQPSMLILQRFIAGRSFEVVKMGPVFAVDFCLYDIVWNGFAPVTLRGGPAEEGGFLIIISDLRGARLARLVWGNSWSWRDTG